MKKHVSFALILTLAGCAGAGPNFLQGARVAPAAAVPVAVDPNAATPVDGAGDGEVMAGAEPSAGKPVAAPAPPPKTARTVEEFDTTTPAAREQAVVAAPKPVVGDGRLGETVASVGDPKDPGFWVKTPLVSERMTGRALYVASGRSVQVQLIPSGGAPGSGSQISLAAMRLLDAPLTGLPVLVLYRN